MLKVWIAVKGDGYGHKFIEGVYLSEQIAREKSANSTGCSVEEWELNLVGLEEQLGRQKKND